MVRRHYTPDLANRSLPLVRSIVQDVQQTAREIQRTWILIQETSAGEADRLHHRLEELRDRFRGLIVELDQLGVELKDPLKGLIDFRARRHGQEVYLCWVLGESSVGHWHAVDAGFAGRRPMSEY